MTLIGQSLMVGFVGQSPHDPEVKVLCSQLQMGRVGGIIFYARNIANKAQAQALVTHLRRCGGYHRPLFAIDQEGGAVDRLGYQHWPDGSGRYSAATFRPQTPRGDDYLATYAVMLDEVALLGFDINFAPVADININPANPIVGRLGRSYGHDADTVWAALEPLLALHEDAGISSTLKHFPGHGSSTTDSHLGFTDITPTWTHGELAPFARVAAQQEQHLGTAIMVGHLVNENLDATGLPASLSSAIVRGLLRDELGFDGAIVSDDMNMQAIVQHYGWDEAAVLALDAGVDMLIQANGSAAKVEQYHRAVQDHLQQRSGFRDELARKGERLDRWSARTFPLPRRRPQHMMPLDPTITGGAGGDTGR